MVKRERWVLVLACVISESALAANANIEHLQTLTQDEFKLLSEDLTGVANFKTVVPAEPLGLTGFDLGFELAASQIEHGDLLQKASAASDALDTVYLPKFHVQKGLPLDLDIGAFYSSLPESNIKVWGGELRYAMLAGGVTMPAIALRGAASRVQGVEQLEFTTAGVDLLISKGFALITPYGGVGQVWVSSKPQGTAQSVLAEERFSQTRVFVGATAGLAIFNVGGEWDKTGGVNTYTVKFGLGF